MITILLAPFGISTRHLEVSIGDWADPDSFPGRWNNQGLEAMELVPISNSLSIRAEVDKPFARALASNARLCVGYIAKAGLLSGDSWVDIDKNFLSGFRSLFEHGRSEIHILLKADVSTGTRASEVSPDIGSETDCTTPEKYSRVAMGPNYRI
jgi:hypothetical protein